MQRSAAAFDCLSAVLSPCWRGRPSRTLALPRGLVLVLPQLGRWSISDRPGPTPWEPNRRTSGFCDGATRTLEEPARPASASPEQAKVHARFLKEDSRGLPCVFYIVGNYETRSAKDEEQGKVIVMFTSS
jgi:hypothetical protein